MTTQPENLKAVRSALERLKCELNATLTVLEIPAMIEDDMFRAMNGQENKVARDEQEKT